MQDKELSTKNKKEKLRLNIKNILIIIYADMIFSFTFKKSKITKFTHFTKVIHT